MTVLRRVFLLLVLLAGAREATAQMSFGPWTIGPAVPFDGGCTPPGACDDCSSSSAVTGGVGSTFVTLKATGEVDHPGTSPAIRCERGLRATSLLTIGPSGTRLIVAADLTGTLDVQWPAAGARSQVSAIVLLNGTPLLDFGILQKAGLGTKPVDEHREDLCVALAPGTYTVLIELLTDAAIPIPLNVPLCFPCPTNMADFKSGSNGLVVSFADDGGPAGTVVAYNSSTFPNPDTLSAPPMVIGQQWTATLTLGLARSGAGPWNLYFGTAGVAPPSGLAIGPSIGGLNFGTAKGGRMLLCNLNTGQSLVGSHNGTPPQMSTVSMNVPCDFSLVNNTWCAQAIVLGPVTTGGGNARLTSALSGVIGTH